MPTVDAETLRGLPHFGGLDAVARRRIAAGSRVRTLERGEWLFRRGSEPRAFFHVLEGCVQLFRSTPEGREQVIHRLRAGQSFAEAAVLTMSAYPVNAVATSSPTRLIEVGASSFLQVLDEDPRVARAVVASLCRRLVRLVQRVDELSVSSFEARLARYLLDLPAAGDGDDLVVRLPLPKKDLAAFLGATPETLSRQLRRWRDAGVADSRGAHITLHQPDVLLAVVADIPVPSHLPV